MNLGKTLFAQLMEFVLWTSFARIVVCYGGDSGARSPNCTEQFRAMAFAQLTYRESLRDIEICLRANRKKLYGMGFRQPVKRSTLADANEGRDWHIWEDLAMALIRRARKLYCSDSFGIELGSAAHALRESDEGWYDGNASLMGCSMGCAELLKTVQPLPKDKQSEVFDFATFLAARYGVAADAGHGEWAENEFAELSLHQAMRGMEGEPAHFTSSDLKECRQ